MSFTTRLRQITNETGSLLCVGLDPDVRRLPQSLRGRPDALIEFCKKIIAATVEHTAAFKLNFAFFEAAGWQGWQALEIVRGLIPDSVLAIADAKRGDIDTSSEMYARAILEDLNFDAVTVNPYMGRDSVAPFLQWPDKGAFILGLTSNPGAEQFQNISVDGTPLHEKVIEQVKFWNGAGNCGLVAGATHTRQLKRVRELAPDLPFLIPGVGAQGGSLEDTILHGTDNEAGLVLVNASRSIIYASDKSDFAEAAAHKAAELTSQIEKLRNQKRNVTT